MPPGLKGRIPEHGERGSGGLHEGLGLFQVVLSAHSDDGEFVRVVSSELLDAGSFPTADGSMGCPEPQHQRPV